MSIITYPLNDVEYTAEDAETYLCTRTSGVYAAESFPATVSDTRKITIGTGMAWINNGNFKGKSVANTENISVEIPIADGALPRIDRIVLRFTKSTNESTIEVKTGTPASSPTPSAVTRSELLYELGLYTVNVPAGSLSVSSADVTNTMLDEDVCGLMRDSVTGLPTDTLQKQYEALIKSMADEIAAIKLGSASMLKDVYDPNSLGISATAQLYTCSKNENTFALDGSGAVGRFKAPETFADGDSFSVNGKIVPAYCGANAVDADTVVKGRWCSFIFDGEQLNFNSGGGLGNSKLALATANADDVLAGKTYYSKDKTIKEGSLPARGANTSPVSYGVSGGNLYARIPEGAYKEKTSAGYPEIEIPVGSAPASAVLAGNNFTSAAAGVNVGGAMRNNGRWPDADRLTLEQGKIYMYKQDGYTEGGLGVAASTLGNASSGHVLSGVSASSQNGIGFGGTMPNRGSWWASLDPGGSVTIPEGYHSGGGSVTARGVNANDAIGKIQYATTTSRVVSNSSIRIIGIANIGQAQGAYFETLQFYITDDGHTATWSKAPGTSWTYAYIQL